MISSRFFARRGYVPMLALALTLALAGCKSKMEKAVDQAKQQAASTGQPQEVVAVDKSGATTTTVVQPPVKGQTAQAVTTTTTPPPQGGPAPAAQDPKVVPMGGGSGQMEATETGQPAPGEPAPAGQSAPAGPPAPATITITAGTSLAIRIDHTISVKSSHAGDGFTGEVVAPINDPNGNAVIPKGTPVAGVVTVAKKRGRFKGASELDLRLTSMTLNGARYHLRTAARAESKKGKGKRSGALIGGGAGLGAIIGGIAGGGKGALIGGLAGGGAGTAGAAFTGNQDLVIPAESVVRFKLTQDLVVQAG